jgi:DNA-binding NtrC family response regulator
MTDSFNTDKGGTDWSRDMIGQSPRFAAAMKLISRLANYDAPVLIEGETGTGKELAARGIHYGGRRRAKPFVPVNCGAIPEHLFENELFGHARGAFTDAGTAGPGLLRLAHQGTLFLDEIDALPAHGQVALLRFLQDGRYRPLGAGQEEAADVRIIAASNRKLETLVEERCFRADLLFRLRVLSLEMPPLRERPGDPLLLADHFLRKFAARYGDTRGKGRSGVDSHTRAWIDSYMWPGNVRELENVILRALLLADDQEFGIAVPDSRLSIRSAHRLPQAAAEDPPQTYAVARLQALGLFDRKYLDDLLQRTQGNVTQAARLAGKERRALGKLLKKYQIDPSRFRK